MKATAILRQVLSVAFCSLVLSLPSQAADLTGVWASDASVCNKMFVKNANRVTFKDDADTYGSGFIIEGNKIRGRSATCDIKSRKEDGGTVHMVAGCATDIMLSNVQLSVKIIDENKISRIFPGIADMEMTYYRCSL
ncbi:MAG: hypothetical protein ACXWIH_30715 [Burkholderiales bacterium]